MTKKERMNREIERGIPFETEKTERRLKRKNNLSYNGKKRGRLLTERRKGGMEKREERMKNKTREKEGDGMERITYQMTSYTGSVLEIEREIDK